MKKKEQEAVPDPIPKANRRVKYTQMVIRQSLLELLKSRPIEKITVTDICARADINRGTFYVYYADPYDLLAQIEQELFEKIRHALAQRSTPTSQLRLCDVLTVIAEERNVCESLFSEFGDKVFLEKLLDLYSMEHWKKNARHIPLASLELSHTFVTSGSLGVIKQWFQRGLNESPDEIAQLIETLSDVSQMKFPPSQE